MAKIVEPPKGKRVECASCGATIEYLPEDVDYFDDVARVKCPRDNCPGHGYVRSGR